MADRRDRLGQPEEENTAHQSTQSASGLGGGTPEGGPAQPLERARRKVADPAERGKDKERPQESE